MRQPRVWLPGLVPAVLAAAALAACLNFSACTGSRKSATDADTSFVPPDVTLAAEAIHSPNGDMMARLPKGWVRLNAPELESPQVFSVACNPEYTMSVIFSEGSIDNATLATVDKVGLRAIAQNAFMRRYNRSGRRAKMFGEVEEFAIGLRKFGAYTYSVDTMKTFTRVAVFATNSHLYECALTQMTFRDNQIPSVRTMKYIQQLILSSVEW